MTACFFGYGSLVNRATHAYAPAYPARVTGWRREWRHLAGRPVAILTAVRDPRAAISGLIAPVPQGDWSALDLREAYYLRHPLGDELRHDGPPDARVQTYAVPDAPPAPVQPILRSYLDVVVQGYLQVFGPEGVQAFFDSTTGWEAPLLDDREAPIYPRHQMLSPQETALVDAHLERIRGG